MSSSISGILVTSFNELVHHMTADYGWLVILLIIVITAIGWGWYDFHCCARAIKRYQGLVESGQYSEPTVTTMSQRLTTLCYIQVWERTPKLFLLGLLAAIVLDYLVLVFLNLVGW